MSTPADKRSKIIADQAAREEAQKATKPVQTRKPRSNWAASSGGGQGRRGFKKTGPA